MYVSYLRVVRRRIHVNRTGSYHNNIVFVTRGDTAPAGRSPQGLIPILIVVRIVDMYRLRQGQSKLDKCISGLVKKARCGINLKCFSSALYYMGNRIYEVCESLFSYLQQLHFQRYSPLADGQTNLFISDMYVQFQI